MSWSLRPFDVERDCAAVARLFSYLDDFQWNEPDVRDNCKRWPEHKPIVRIAAERDGETVGYGRACEFSKNPMGSYMLEVIVEPSAQGQGIGTELVSRLEEFSLGQGAKCAVGLVREIHPTALSFVEKAGYEKKTLYYDCVCDPRTFDPGAHQGVFDRLAHDGYRVVALAELPDGESTDRALYDAMIEADHDAPFMDYFGYPTFEDYKRMTLGAKWFDRNGTFVALKGDEIVGLSNVNRGSVEFNGEMFIEFTGVKRDHRGHGLATAMKVRALEFAKRIGGTMVRTENNTDNPAMLKVNRRLGFVDKPGQWLIVKPLGRTADVV